MKRPKGANSSLRPFEKEMLKYYPKQFRTFQNFLMCQGNPPADANGIKAPSVHPIENYTPHRKILRKYNNGFLRLFSAYYKLESPIPTKIPHALESLIIVEGPNILLKKLIKQNKGLKHISVNSSDWRVCQMMTKYLRFSKSLRSITFQKLFPSFSEIMCRQTLRNWANKMEKIEVLGKLFSYFEDEKKFKRVMESFLQFPRLKEFRFFNGDNHTVMHFPMEKLLQERNIAYDVRFTVKGGYFVPLMKNLSECKPVDCLVITDRNEEDKLKRARAKKWEIEQFSKRILRLNFSHNYLDELHPSPVFENIQSLQLDLCQNKCEYSNFGQLISLKHLSVDIRSVQKTSYLKDFFSFLNENVAPYKKLETLLIKGKFQSGIDEESANPMIRFFEACSKTLRKAYIELKSSQSQDDSYLRDIYESLSKIEELRSLTLLVSSPNSESKERLEELTKTISRMKSLEELEFRIKECNFDEDKLDLSFPSQLLRLRIDSCFGSSKTPGPLLNLTHLELTFTDFSSWKFQKILKAPMLEVLILKEKNAYRYDKDDILEYKPRLDGLMKEGLSLKLVVFAYIERREMIILRRKNYPWSEINPIIDEIPFKKPVKFRYIQSY